MRYVCLIYDNKATQAQIPPEQGQQQMSEYWAFTYEIKEAGVNQGISEALMPTSTATTGRVRDGKIHTTDGPFAETKEQLGGFYVLKCENLDEAIKWIAKMPDTRDDSMAVSLVSD